MIKVLMFQIHPPMAAGEIAKKFLYKQGQLLYFNWQSKQPQA
jgi:hypothetical protein